ncbi:ethanolamine utilization protein EutJ [Desulfovibrio desulfuricans]|uniref:ethanolamine utilization protein EutJ n=1 Tax=Desulfovibrio desulfuricans TaxID=876 RepID=UPI0003B79688|nr:ethanolamine utilization protein EutJ [Desulfovibrio desulfuricans]MDD3684395.1 ethanolamine utilization protein EutJ [Desulfovibrio desulfuricans]QTO39393.1 ethanolamine utilization protein EutJ [Desulfovibrio desulfuricans]
MDFAAADKLIATLDQCRENPRKVSPTEPLYVGVDLGTAYIVVVVVNAKREPVACAMRFAQVVRDGLVVDYAGGARIVRELTEELEERLGRKLENAAIAVPPGTSERDCATHRHVAEAAGYRVTALLDEPTAANSVLQVRDGAIVDIGGGTTGIALLQDGKVVYVADEPTGGTHVSLVLSGNYDIPFDEAEDLKKDASRHKELLPVVRPVIEKMAAIIRKHIQGRKVSALYLVGGTCCLADMESIIQKDTGVPTFKPANPFLVTPLGIALNCTDSSL